jgi:hypothetical protein
MVFFSIDIPIENPMTHYTKTEIIYSKYGYGRLWDAMGKKGKKGKHWLPMEPQNWTCYVKYHTMYRGCKINKAVLKYHSAPR